MRIGHLSLFAGSGRDEAVDKAQDRDGTQGDANDGTVDILAGNETGIRWILFGVAFCRWCSDRN